MKQKPPTSATPEEMELFRKTSELSALESELVQTELDLATLKAELAIFEQVYLRVVAKKQAELDRLEAEISALLAKLSPNDTQACRYAEEAKRVADTSAQTVNEANREPPAPAAIPTSELKSLFRKAALQVHPDLASTDEERERRHKIMTEVNTAYREGDSVRLESILREWHDSPEAVSGGGIAADLVRAIRRIAQVQNRLSRIMSDLKEYRSYAMHELLEHTKLAASQGRDYLAELTAVLDEKIATSNNRLKELRRKVDQRR